MLKSFPARFRYYLGISFFVLLIMSCVYSFVRAPEIMCILEKCNDTMSKITVPMFPRTVATVCIVSRIALACKSHSNQFADYEERIKQYDLKFPNGVSKQFVKYVYVVLVVVVCVTIIVLTNAYRIYLFYVHYDSWELIVYFLLMYTQNMITCLSDIKFISYCSGLYQYFQLINQEISGIKSITIVINRYPLVLQYDGNNPVDNAAATLASKDSRGIPNRVKQYQLSKNIETLKMRHQFVSHMIRDLNALYEIHLGVTLLGLFVMTLFDIFDAINTNDYGHQTKNIYLIYCWLSQYSFRFCVIVLTAHFTTSQVRNLRNRDRAIKRIYNLFFFQAIHFSINYK